MEIIRKIQVAELEVLDEVARICDKHNITYFLAYGTLLGAIRHEGFIPWDDDVDLVMLREDYNRFLKIAETELSHDYFLQYQKTEKNYWLPYAKVRRRNTIYAELKAPNTIKEKGFWVDIFPLDLISDKTDKKIVRKVKQISLIKKFIHIKRIADNSDDSTTSWRIRLLIKLCNLFGLNNEKLLNLCCKIAISKSCGQYLIDFAESAPLAKVIKLSDLLPAQKAKFENNYYYIPNNPDSVLQTLYGNYMQLPPVEERQYHPADQIVFDTTVEHS